MNETSQYEEMKSYLFYEMSEDESDSFEEHYFEDTDYFYTLLEFEQDLIDKYAIGKLSGEDFKRFEKSLAKSPERVERVVEARALQQIIAEEKTKAETVSAATTVESTSKIGIWEKISSFFSIQPFTLKFATGTLAILMFFGIGFVIYQQIQKRQEKQLADESERQRLEQQKIEEQRRLDELIRQQKEQQNSSINNFDSNTIKNSNSEKELTNSNVNNNRDKNQKLTNEDSNKLSNEEIQRKIDDQKKKLEELDKKKDAIPANKVEIKPSQPTLAFSFIPQGIRGGFRMAADGKEEKNGIRLTIKIPEQNNYQSIEITPKGKESITIPVPNGATTLTYNLPYKPESDTEVYFGVTEKNTRGGSETLGSLKITVKNNKKPKK